VSIHPNIPHPWKPEGLGQIAALSKETNRPMSQRILEAAQELAVISQTDHENFHPQEKKA
jgi:hypothetical protein